MSQGKCSAEVRRWINIQFRAALTDPEVMEKAAIAMAQKSLLGADVIESLRSGIAAGVMACAGLDFKDEIEFLDTLENGDDPF